jgi:hypothetical protein
MGKNSKVWRANQAPPGMEDRVGVGHPSNYRSSDRCRETHNVPYNLRCILEVSHTGPCRDKEMNEWMAEP